jgi:hypothetical protein
MHRDRRQLRFERKRAEHGGEQDRDPEHGDLHAWRADGNAGKPADLSDRAGNRAEIVATYLAHRSKNGRTLEPRYLLSTRSGSHDLSG